MKFFKNLFKGFFKDKPVIPEMDSAILYQYLDFFVTRHNEINMLPFMFTSDESLYLKLVTKCPHYYLDREERNIISSNKKLLKKHLTKFSGPVDIIEIDPKYEYDITNKTLPLIAPIKNIASYSIINTSLLPDKVNLVDLVYKSRPDIPTRSAEEQPLRPKIILWLNNNIGEHYESKREEILKKLSRMTRTEDLFIFTLDTNPDKKSIMKSYDNRYMRPILKGVLKYFSSYCPDFALVEDNMEMEIKYTGDVELYYHVKELSTFRIPYLSRTHMTKDTVLKCGVFHKFRSDDLLHIAYFKGFGVEETMTSGNVSMFITKKLIHN